MDKPGTAENSFVARKFEVAIQIDEFGDEDGELTISGSLLGKGDPVVGTATITNGVATFTANSVSA